MGSRRFLRVSARSGTRLGNRRVGRRSLSWRKEWPRDSVAEGIDGTFVGPRWRRHEPSTGKVFRDQVDRVEGEIDRLTER